MRRLLILRHAKAGRDAVTPDFDRPLMDRGRADAAAMGAWMVARGLLPERILCSSSRRTRETLAGLLSALGGDCEILLTRALYAPEQGSYLPIVARQGGDAATLMVIGHNPHAHELSRGLSRSGDTVMLAGLHERFPTGSLAVIDFDAAHWRRIGSVPGHLTAFVRPDELPPG